MSEVINLSRRDFLKTGAALGGGLLIGFHAPGAVRSAKAAAIQENFKPNAFIRIGRDGRVSLIMHKAEMGQGVYTSMPMLIAEELEVDLGQIHLEHAPPDDKL
jgi:isoquinoline 1-oxidoreductase subunit beta